MSDFLESIDDLIGGEYPLLRRLFRDYAVTYSAIEAADPSGIERRRAELLLERAQTLRIDGLNKLAEDAANYGKFVNLLAELRFAILLAGRGARVEMLRDQAFGSPGIATPDLRAVLPGGIEALIEVTTCSGWWPKLLAQLDATMLAAGLGFRVEFVLGSELGGSVADHDGRTRNDQLCADAAREIVRGLESAKNAGLSHGTVHLFRSVGTLRHELEVGQRDRLPLPDDVATGEGETLLGSFVFEPARGGTGETGGGAIAAHWIDVSSHESRFLYHLAAKALKRNKFPSAHGSTLYFVAVQNDEIELPPDAVLSALTGSRTFTWMPVHERARWQRANPVALPPAIRSAAYDGWQRLFTEWDYDEEAQYRMTDYGAYFDRAATWARNLSGVWVLHRPRSVVQWLPNPLAAPEINDVRLLELGFSIAKGGEPTDTV